MKFAHRLISHLTPEWRNHYIHYEKLKHMIYDITGQPRSTSGDDDEEPQVGVVNIDAAQVEEFFEEVQRELDGVDRFFRKQEAKLLYQFREIEEAVNILMAAIANSGSRKLNRKREALKEVISEYYLSITLLQNFQQLNHTGFRKILKKFDKLARSERGGRYFKGTVCSNYFWVSKEPDQLILQTETVMIDKLEKGNRSKAMNRLRVPPLGKKDKRSHWATLRAGWLMGFIFVSIVVVTLGIIFHPRGSWTVQGPVFRGLRGWLMIVLWFFAFSINTYGWRRSGVNSVLVFEFNPRNFLNYVQLFEISSLLGVVWFIGLYLTVFSYQLQIPSYSGVIAIFILMLILFAFPLPFLYYRSRIWLAKELGRVLCAPFFQVTFPDFWIADQLNSLVAVFLDFEYFLCYMVYGLHFPDNTVQCGAVIYAVRPLIAILPAWFRFAQCVRRYRDTKDAFPHLVNAGKYATAFPVVFFSAFGKGIRQQYGTQVPTYYYAIFGLWIIASILSAGYSFAWDIKMDWGLFEGKYITRSERIYSRKIYYVLAMVENLFLRAAWTLNISVGEAGAEILNEDVISTILIILEIFRRFVWNFFRLENEHLNNCGQFRVVRDISIRPLYLSRTEEEREGEGEEGGEEEGRERGRNRYIREQRRMSTILMELSENPSTSRQYFHRSPILPIRKNSPASLEGMDSGLYTRSSRNPSVILEEEEIGASMHSLHSTTL